MEKYKFDISSNSLNNKIEELDKLLKDEIISLEDYFDEINHIKNNCSFEEAIDVPLKKAEIEINNNSKNLNIKNIDFDTYSANINSFFDEKKSNIEEQIYNLQLEFFNGNIDFENFSNKYKAILNENIDIVG